MMPRDMDLIRELMLRFEQGNRLIPDGCDQKKFDYHIYLMIDSGLIEGDFIWATDRGTRYPSAGYINRITTKGHDFIDHVRNAGTWNWIKTQLSEKALPSTIDVILDLAKKAVQLGLSFVQ